MQNFNGLAYFFKYCIPYSFTQKIKKRINKKNSCVDVRKMTDLSLFYFLCLAQIFSTLIESNSRTTQPIIIKFLLL